MTHDEIYAMHRKHVGVLSIAATAGKSTQHIKLIIAEAQAKHEKREGTWNGYGLSKRDRDVLTRAKIKPGDIDALKAMTFAELRTIPLCGVGTVSEIYTVLLGRPPHVSALKHARFRDYVK